MRCGKYKSRKNRKRALASRGQLPSQTAGTFNVEQRNAGNVFVEAMMRMLHSSRGK